MKNLYIKSILITMLIGIICNSLSFSQSTATGHTYNGGFLGWDNSNGTNPLLFKTNNLNRMKLNGNLNYSLDNYNGVRDGHLLLSIPNSNLYNNNTGAYSMFHINGPGSFVSTGGFRPWMKTGITFTGNRDLSYMGIRQVGSAEDITETTIAWSDNSCTTSPGPDDMVFRFLGGGNGNNSVSTNLTNVNDLDGLHVARFTPTG